MEEHQNKKFRYERKYLIELNLLPWFLAQLYSSGFSLSFPNRRVNNIYFDDYNFSSLNDNFDGLSIRNKYRVRWYSKLFGESNKTLEVKMKSEFLNVKKFYDLKSIRLDSLKDIDNFCSKVKSALKNNYELLRMVSDKRPTLLNSYERAYFENKSKNIRLTIDKDLYYYSPITKINFKENFIIVEIKYNKKVNFSNELKKLSFTRYSKYVKGTSQTTFSNTIY